MSAATTAAARQRAFRERQAAKIARMEAALRKIEAKLEGTTKPAALAVLEIVKEGLAG